MAEPFVINATAVQALSDQVWRRIGVTQTFERLLVEAALTTPGSSDAVSEVAAQTLSGGAARFWDLSRDQLERDLCRRRILIKRDGILQAHEEFAERLNRIMDDHEAGVSRVAPTPGVTIEEVMRQSELNQQAAAKKEAAKKAAAKKRSTTGTGRPRRSSGLAKPIKRPGAQSPALGTAEVAQPEPPPPAAPTPAKRLFTSNRVNRLLDHLDDTVLSTAQLASRLELTGSQVKEFLSVTDTLQVTRVSKDNLVDLHWRGREVVRTTSVDRRMTVIDLVKELRTTAESEDG